METTCSVFRCIFEGAVECGRTRLPRVAVATSELERCDSVGLSCLRWSLPSLTRVRVRSECGWRRRWQRLPWLVGWSHGSPRLKHVATNFSEEPGIIVLPLLRQYRENCPGGTRVDPEDVLTLPDVELAAEGHWKLALDEMIFAFYEHLKTDSVRTVNETHEARIENGFRLFGKYYRALWQ